MTLLSETTAKGTGLEKSAGKEDPVELDSSLTFVKGLKGCRISGRHCQVGSLAGAAHLLKDNAGVLRVRGVRKVTTGITGLWQPSVHSDVAFWSFDVGSSYHTDAQGNGAKLSSVGLWLNASKPEA
ncbi:16614_t:CDS:2 [Funneliformis geosporum]|uniref:9323_t:CDS:1 n=1 Tax=Funneliformis geosporum TaxID=1117311 RepID=A0A9W4WNJ7_9GLOM|nr:9323_t:CDS:2 [Funneliformis geosporum]CAI2191633.1 16614_t:CDS:2 [Funneliformis geosporum]